MRIKKISAPLVLSEIKGLQAGDEVLISGTILVARDAAHKRLVDLIEKKKPLPVVLKDQVIFYAGPSPAAPGRVIGSIGPTTSYRMDPYTDEMLKQGVRGMIGKGERSDEVNKAMKKAGAIYFVAVGGIAALLSQQVVSSKILAYGDLGAEAIRELEVKDFPVIVAQDSYGKNVLK